MNIVNLPIDLRTLSHELRTPLTGILGIAEFLSHEQSLTLQQQCYVSDIREAGDRLLKLANCLQQAKELK